MLSFAAVFRDEVHGMIGARLFSLTPRSRLVRNMSHARYSFTQSEFINPRILADLSGLISDAGDQVVAVNVAESNRSNRYFVIAAPEFRRYLRREEQGRHLAGCIKRRGHFSAARAEQRVAVAAAVLAAAVLAA